MMYLQMSQEHVRQITAHAVAEQPSEACGLVAGIGRQVQAVYPLRNIAADPQHTYRIEDRGLSDTLFALNKAGLSLLGFYHSHPQNDPIPSPMDIQFANYPDVACIIVGLRHKPRLAAWSIRYGRVLPIELHIGMGTPTQDSELSFTQRAAIAAAAVLAFIFLIMLAVSLLPPAPELPLPQ